METEAKFVVPDSTTFAELEALPRLAEFHLQPGGTEDITDRYLDTADYRLFRADFACRIRTKADRLRLTLKSLTPSTDYIHRRREIEATIPSDQPDDWPDSEAQQLLMELSQGQPLQTLFTIYQSRHKAKVSQQDEPLLEFSLDEVSLHAPDTVDYFELEIELLPNGTEAELDRFVKALQTRWSLPVETKSKFERACLEHLPQIRKEPSS